MVFLDADNGSPFLWIRSIVGEILEGLKWDGSHFSVEASLFFQSVELSNLRIVHYYGLTEFWHAGIFDFVRCHITGWPYIKVKATLDRVSRYFFNKKKLVTKRRMDLLKVVLPKHLDSATPVDELSLMTDLYTIEWTNHPGADAQQNTLELYLASVVKSGDLTKDNYGYFGVTKRTANTRKI